MIQRLGYVVAMTETKEIIWGTSEDWRVLTPTGRGAKAN
jgi:hypothetical protein